ncbi:MAG: alpha/beta hydrolase [Sphaerochaetaceae bacterium]
MKTLKLKLSDGKELTYREWLPEGEVKGVILILHGMAEHGARYADFAKYLNSLGYGVYVPDHRGHGLTAEEGELGYFAPKNGWQRVVEDAYELAQKITEDYPKSKLYLFGHSMGSFLARDLITQHPKLFKAVILSGTGASQGFLGVIGKGIAKTKALFNGGRKRDKLLDKLSFGSFSTAFKPIKTKFDWLSRDEKMVKAYIDDPLCGFVCTSQFFVDLLEGVKRANDPRLMANIPKNFPIYLISGSEDPVGDFGKGVEKVLQLYKNAGLKRVKMELIEDARHEVLNETNRKEVYKVVGEWLK